MFNESKLAGKMAEHHISGDKMAKEIFEKMQAHGVLIRKPQANALRINSGTKEENAACLSALEASLKELEQ